MLRLFTFVWIAALLATGAVFGGEPSPRSKNKQEEIKTVFVTGSLIPRRVKVRRIGTTTESPLRVIDRDEIDKTGRFTTAGAFVNDPSVRVIGR